MAKRPLFSFPSDFGSYLALVFEFLGFLGLGGVAGYICQEYIWPEYGDWIFPAVFLFMFLLGLWFMVKQTKRLSQQALERSKKEEQEKSDPPLSPDLVEKRMKEFDAKFNRAFKRDR
ncbi:MAG: hypothetical protein CMN76_11215 [Spirochaetaceae bacterium]|nr:hypothetical protein [Spirochaetaceae bacterium]